MRHHRDDILVPRPQPSPHLARSLLHRRQQRGIDSLLTIPALLHRAIINLGPNLHADRVVAFAQHAWNQSPQLVSRLSDVAVLPPDFLCQREQQEGHVGPRQSGGERQRGRLDCAFERRGDDERDGGVVGEFGAQSGALCVAEGRDERVAQVVPVLCNCSVSVSKQTNLHQLSDLDIVESLGVAHEVNRLWRHGGDRRSLRPNVCGQGRSPAEEEQKPNSWSLISVVGLGLHHGFGTAAMMTPRCHCESYSRA